MLELSAYLREARENAGLTQTEVASRLGYSNSQFISNWERGLSTPPLNTLRTLSKMYHIDMDELFEQIVKTSMEIAENSMRKKYSLLKKRR